MNRAMKIDLGKQIKALVNAHGAERAYSVRASSEAVKNGITPMYWSHVDSEKHWEERQIKIRTLIKRVYGIDLG